MPTDHSCRLEPTSMGGATLDNMAAIEDLVLAFAALLRRVWAKHLAREMRSWMTYCPSPWSWASWLEEEGQGIRVVQAAPATND